MRYHSTLSACLKNAVITGGQIGLNVTYSELESPFPLHSCPSQLPLFVILTGNAVSSAHKVSHHLSSARRRGEIRVGASLTSGESRRRPSAQDMTKGPSARLVPLSVCLLCLPRQLSGPTGLRSDELSRPIWQSTLLVRSFGFVNIESGLS